MRNLIHITASRCYGGILPLTHWSNELLRSVIICRWRLIVSGSLKQSTYFLTNKISSPRYIQTKANVHEIHSRLEEAVFVWTMNVPSKPRWFLCKTLIWLYLHDDSLQSDCSRHNTCMASPIYKHVFTQNCIGNVNNRSEIMCMLNTSTKSN